MNKQFATSAMNQVIGMAPRVAIAPGAGQSRAIARDGQETRRPVAELVRPVWIALLALLFGTGVGLGTGELLTYLFAESWDVNGLFGV